MSMGLNVQLVRYYGTYSNVSRGKRKKEEHKKDVIGKPEFVVNVPASMTPNAVETSLLKSLRVRVLSTVRSCSQREEKRVAFSL